MTLAADFLSAVADAFAANKRLADRAVAQVPDDKLHAALDPHTNSIAVVMKHVAGNLTSRWTDFLTTDGEKPVPGGNRPQLDGTRPPWIWLSPATLRETGDVRRPRDREILPERRVIDCHPSRPSLGCSGSLGS